MKYLWSIVIIKVAPNEHNHTQLSLFANLDRRTAVRTSKSSYFSSSVIGQMRIGSNSSSIIEL